MGMKDGWWPADMNLPCITLLTTIFSLKRKKGSSRFRGTPFKGADSILIHTLKRGVAPLCQLPTGFVGQDSKYSLVPSFIRNSQSEFRSEAVNINSVKQTINMPKQWVGSAFSWPSFSLHLSGQRGYAVCD